MKSLVAYYLLLLYCVAICKPVLPVFQDFVAHALFLHQHITVVHHENGKDHLDIELGDAAKENGTENSNTKPKSFDETTVHFPVECQEMLPTHQPLLVHVYFDPPGNLLFAFKAIYVPPPEV